MRTFIGASGELRAEDVSESDFQDVTFLLYEGYLLYQPEVTERLFDLAEKYGVPVGIDLASFEVVERFRMELLHLLPQCDAVFANQDEAAALFGPDKTEMEYLDGLASFARTAVLKMGRNGAMIRMNGRTVSVAADPVRVVDTTGAGDLWQAGFLYGYLRGKSPELCGRFAAAAAAKIVAVYGAHLPKKEWIALKQQFDLWENER